MIFKISVIVPVYNVENYIERCARSLFEQTMKEGVEYIFVNDCTPDHSMQVIEDVVSDYPERQKQILYVNHSSNSGASMARNSGLAIAQGEYVYFADGDDWVEKEMLEEMYKVAQKNDADIVRSDFFCVNDKYVETKHQPSEVDPMECVKLLLSEKLHGAFWNKIVKRSLFLEHEIVIYDGYWEDLRASVQLFYYAKRITYIPKAYYHYVQDNPNALTMQNYEKKLEDMIRNTNGIIQFLKEKDVYLEKYFNYLKLGVKRGLLITCEKRSFRKWLQIYPESNRYIWSYPSLPFHLRMVGGCTAMRLWPLIDLWIQVKKWRNR